MPEHGTPSVTGVVPTDAHFHWRAVCVERRPYRSGRGRRKRTRTTGTSPAAYFTLWEPGGEIPPGYPTVIQCSARDLLEERLTTEDYWIDAEVRIARVRRRRQFPSSGAKVYRLGAHQG